MRFFNAFAIIPERPRERRVAPTIGTLGRLTVRHDIRLAAPCAPPYLAVHDHRPAAAGAVLCAARGRSAPVRLRRESRPLHSGAQRLFRHRFFDGQSQRGQALFLQWCLLAAATVLFLGHEKTAYRLSLWVMGESTTAGW